MRKVVVLALLLFVATVAQAQFVYVPGSVTGVVSGSSSGATIAVPLHQTPGAGHLLFCMGTWQSSTATARLSDPNNGNWTAIGSAKPGVGGLSPYSGQMFYVPTAVNAPTTVTMTISAVVGFRSLECVEYSYTGTLALDGTPQYSTAPATNGIAIVSGVNTLKTGDLILAACIGVDTHCSVGTGYTLRDDPNTLNAGNGTLGHSFIGLTGQTIEDKSSLSVGGQAATFGTSMAKDNVILGLLAASNTVGPPPDTTPPVILILIPSARTATSPSLVTAKITDDSGGPLTVTGTIDGQALPLPSVSGTTYIFGSPDLNALLVGATHFVSVTAKDAAGNTASSSVSFVNAVVTTLTAVPAAHSVGLSWGLPASGPTPTSYNIYRWTSGPRPATPIASVTVLAYTDTAVTNGATYSYAVTSVANNVESTPAGPVTAVVPN